MVGRPLKAYRALRGEAGEPLAVRTVRLEQSNSAVIYGDRLLLKMFRRIEEGTNPDLELSRFLSETVRFPHTPTLAGSLEYQDDGGRVSTMGILQEFVRNEGDAWSHALEHAHRFFDRVLTSHPSCPPAESDFPHQGLLAGFKTEPTPLVRELCDNYLELARLLGQRTGEMHRALASSVDVPELAPEPFSELYQRSVYQGMRSYSRKAFRLLRNRLKLLPEDVQADALTLLLLEQEILDRFQLIVGHKLGGARIRCHGDYHLGQVLFTGKDFMIIDFEGEPTRPFSERRIKRTPLRDVAGMLRSFDYASQTILLNQIAGIVQESELRNVQTWARYWSTWVGAQFLDSYVDTVRDASFTTTEPGEMQVLLQVALLEKAVYELAYELNNRPSWVRVPLSGILQLLSSPA